MMRRLSMVLVLSSVLLVAAVPRADVAPFPSWQVALNGHAATANANGVIYYGGDFTKVGRALAPFSARLDPLSLSMTPLSGCARRGGTLVDGPYVDFPGGLTDGDGPFNVPAGTKLVRIGPDCRFDRRFRVELPAGVSIADADDIVELGNRLYFNAYVSDYPQGRFDVYVVEADRTAGALTRAWFMGNGSGVRIAGAAGGHVIVAEFMGVTGFTLGWFDTATGLVQPKQTLPNEWSILHVGDTIVTRRSEGVGVRLTAFDAATLDPLPQWPAVHSDNNFFQTFASAGGRLFIAEESLAVDGVAMPKVVAFDAVTGARVTGFTAPSWLDDGSVVSTLMVSGGRLLIFGDFAPGAPRDMAVALDAATGSLDPWTWTYAASPASVVAGQVYFPAIAAENRVHREYLVAFDERSGTMLPWTPSPVPATAVTGLAVDPASPTLYVGRTDALRRYDLATGVEDPSWGLDLQGGGAYALAFLQDTVYMTGYLQAASQRGAATFLPREGAAAVTTSGTLTAWRPMLRAVCSVVRGGLQYPCVSQLAAFESHLIAVGSIQRLQAPPDASRSLIALDPVSGAVDPFLPPVTTPVPAVAVGGATLYAVASLPEWRVVTVDAAGAARALVSLSGQSGLGVHNGRLYAEVERDLATGVPTGNPMDFRTVSSMGSGVGSLAGWHVDIAPIAPRPPENLNAATRGARVTLNWTAGTGDLAPFVPAPPGGTAAMSHTVLASLTPGGPPVASIPTASPDTTWSVDAPPGQYWLRVVAQNQFGVSAPSNEVRVLVSPAAPPRPTATRAVVTGGVVHIDWQPPVGGWPATSYLLDAGTAPGLTNLGTLPVNGTSFDAPVPPGRYYVRIRAVNAYGASGPGDEVVIDVP